MERIRYLCSEYNLSEFSKHYFVFCDLCHWLTINMKMFYYISEQCPYIKIMIDCVGGFCWPTHAAMQSIENHIWRSRFAISTKLKLYNTCILPVFLYGLDCWAISKTDARRIDALDQWRLRMLLDIKWYQFVRNDEVRRLTKQPKTHCYNPVAPAYPIWAYYAHGQQCRCQEDPVSLPSSGLEKTTRSSPHHVA